MPKYKRKKRPGGSLPTAAERFPRGKSASLITDPQWTVLKKVVRHLHRTGQLPTLFELVGSDKTQTIRAFDIRRALRDLTAKGFPKYGPRGTEGWSLPHATLQALQDHKELLDVVVHR